MRALWALGLLLGCEAAVTGGRVGALPGDEWPRRPVVVAPELRAAPVATPTIAPPRVIAGALLPPSVRGAEQTDSFVVEDAEVDVLWIVDNSGSLNSERARLGQQFERFVRALVAGRVDFHVGVTSTDLDPSTGDGGRLRGPARWIDRSTPDPRASFLAAVDFPPSDVSLEEGLAAMRLALSPPNTLGPNLGFLRDEAALAVIVVSDEDDASIGPLAFFSRFLRGLKGPGRDANVSFSAVAGPLPDGCVPPGEERIFGADAKPAERYSELVGDTGGLFASICGADFGPFMDELARALTPARRVFTLSAPPVLSTLRVLVDGRAVPRDAQNGWSWNASERAIELNGRAVPAPGARLEIRYDVAI